MKDNKELKIAAIVGAIMVIFCIVMIIYASNNSGVKEQEKLLKNSFMVYKNTTIDGKRAYVPCEGDANLIEIQEEFSKIKTATEESTDTNITGTYRVGTEKDFIAFDEDHKNNVFIKSKNKLFNIESDLYDKVIEMCK